MDWNDLTIAFLIIRVMPYVAGKVYWTMSSLPAIFGQNIVLTCHLEYILTNPKDCPVRQWSGGPKRIGLVYNGYSSDYNKYEEDVNLGSMEFSLIIKKLAESDINVNYTCSCEFHSSTQNLSLDKNSFHYPPAGINYTFSVGNGCLQVLFELKKVYPVPDCSLYLGKNLISESIHLTIKQNGQVYNVMNNSTYTMNEHECNEQPVLKCSFYDVAEPVIFRGNKKFVCTASTSEPNHLNNATITYNEKEDLKIIIDTTVKITFIVVPVLLISFFIVVIVWKYPHRCHCKCKRSLERGTNNSTENDFFIN
ncbi:uncharacterized protein [Mytilus edulis]|uniref:uncharacterized protein n=1 Tax=Mytilus edulis TaxID=6550 RepID=UPI0039F031E1